jgi:hypothetical protein
MLAPLYIPESLLLEAERFRTHPAFPDAVRLYAERLLGVYDRQPLLNRLIREEARWVISGFALYLHFTRDPADLTSGATLGRLQALSAAHGLASPSRVATLIALMRVGGFLVQTTTQTDRRVRRLEPTEAMLAYARPWLAANLDAIRLLSPDSAFYDQLDHDTDFIGRFYREAGTLFMSGVRVMDAVPGIRLFSGRDAGYMILLRLWLSDPDRAFPPRRLVVLPYEELARTFGVSRSHVRKLMEAAAAHGLVRLHADDGRAIEVLPPLVTLFAECLALQLAKIAQCARTIAQDHARRPADALTQARLAIDIM